MTNKSELLAKIEEYKAALAQDPKSLLFVELVDAYLADGQVDDALEVALRGTWELPQFADGYAAVGRVYLQRRVSGKAEAAFYKALSIDQMCIAAYKGLAVILKNKGDIQKASDILTKAIMLDPGDLSLQQMIGSLSAPAGTVSQAQADVEIDEPEEPESAPVAGGMKPITTATIADIYVEQGLYDKALEVYQELLTSNPHDAAAKQKISELESLMRNSGGEVASGSMTSQVTDNMTMRTSESIGGESVIEKLSGWLSAIQARRSRV